jgi:hypothetical protein
MRIIIEDHRLIYTWEVRGLTPPITVDSILGAIQIEREIRCYICDGQVLPSFLYGDGPNKRRWWKDEQQTMHVQCILDPNYMPSSQEDWDMMNQVRTSLGHQVRRWGIYTNIMASDEDIIDWMRAYLKEGMTPDQLGGVASHYFGEPDGLPLYIRLAIEMMRQENV